MKHELDSLLVMIGNGAGDKNPTVVKGKHASVNYYPEPEAVEQEAFYLGDSKPHYNTIERGKGAITLHCHHHAYEWKQKYNGKKTGKTVPNKVRLVRPEDEAMLREAHAAMVAATQAYREARVKAYANGQKCTAAVAKRLVTDWPRFSRAGAGMHAEMAVMIKAPRSLRTIIIVRVNRKGVLMPIHPCKQCAEKAEELGITIKSIG